MNTRWRCHATGFALAALTLGVEPSSAAEAQSQTPNIILIVSDDFGYGDSSPYGGAQGAGCRRPASSGSRTRA